MKDELTLKGRVHAKVTKANGNVLEQKVSNVLTNEFITHVLQTSVGTVSGFGAWYMGFKDDTGDPIDGTETYATPVFSEITNYSQVSRVLWDISTPSGKSATNSASSAIFNIDSDVTVTGIFVASYPEKEDTAESGAVLLSVANFGTPLDNLSSDDTVEISYKVTGADDGA